MTVTVPGRPPQRFDKLPCDPKFKELARLGQPLTVFLFYYGVEYNQPEYMMRRWKDAGARRVAFLPMRGFMARPSQFVRATTAARRGQADGTCGFAFPVGAESPENVWQWKSVMLAAWANFPTPELDAYCFIEEPAELVEALAACDVTVASNGTDVKNFIARLDELLPGKVRPVAGAGVPESQPKGHMRILVGGPEIFANADWTCDLRKVDFGAGKGVIQMQQRTVTLRGTNTAGVSNAMKLFTRFAELARAERGQ